MARLRNVNRSQKYEALVQGLARQGNGGSVFSTIRELMCFAALLGYELGAREQLPTDKGVEDIQISIFENNDSIDYIYMIAVGETGGTDVLRSDSEIDMVTIFEEYAHGGLGIIEDWMNQFSDTEGFKAIIQGLYSSGFISDETISEQDLIKSVSF